MCSYQDERAQSLFFVIVFGRWLRGHGRVGLQVRGDDLPEGIVGEDEPVCIRSLASHAWLARLNDV